MVYERAGKDQNFSGEGNTYQKVFMIINQPLTVNETSRNFLANIRLFNSAENKFMEELQ